MSKYSHLLGIGYTWTIRAILQVLDPMLIGGGSAGHVALWWESMRLNKRLIL